MQAYATQKHPVGQTGKFNVNYKQVLEFVKEKHKNGIPSTRQTT
jgi:hypothetical protein